MDAAFLLSGPLVPAGLDLGRIDMRDVAPTLAGQIGLSLPQAEGRDCLAGGVARSARLGRRLDAVGEALGQGQRR
jgi:hypothetical protein